MSSSLYHASSGFVLGGLILSASGDMGPMAFLSAIISVLIDMDALLSPDREHESILHSSYLPLTLVPLCLVSAFLPQLGPLPALALAAFASHLALDSLRGEPMHPRDPLLRRVPPHALEGPKLARALELLSLPASLALMMV